MAPTSRSQTTERTLHMASQFPCVEQQPKIPLWLWPNLLSLDAPVIALLWLYLFAHSARVTLAPGVTMVAALTVWLIYVADRVLDSLQGARIGTPARHRFYFAHRRAIVIPFLVALFLSSWICATHLDSETLALGAVFISAVGMYFAAIHITCPKPTRFAKEAVFAILFGTGTYLPVWIHEPRLSFGRAVSVGFFILLCWMNSVLIEYSEWSSAASSDSEPPHISTITAGFHMFELGIGMALILLSLLLCGLFSWYYPVLLVELLSAISLTALGKYWRRLSLDIVRVAADATLLTPALFLPFLHR